MVSSHFWFDEFSTRIGSEVEDLWGGRLVQQAPSLSVEIPGSNEVRWLMSSQNDIEVDIEVDDDYSDNYDDDEYEN